MKACSHKCSMLLLCALCPNLPNVMIIREFLDLCPSRLRKSIILQHGFQLQYVLWLSNPVDWWMEATDSEGEEDRRWNPNLRTLSETYVCRDGFASASFPHVNLHARVWTNTRLLDIVSLYLIDGVSHDSLKTPEALLESRNRFDASTLESSLGTVQVALQILALEFSKRRMVLC